MSMKTSKPVLTHAAVFVCGAALAVVVSRPSGDRSENGIDSASTRTTVSSRERQEVSETDTRSASRRGRQENADLSGARGNDSASVRLQEINRIGDALERQSALMDLVNRLSPAEFAAVAEEYRNMEHFGNSRGESDIILRGWAKVDPLGALEYASNQPNSREQSSVILSTWAGKDASAAERWALDHHEGDGPNPFMAAVIRGIAAYDIAHASRLAESMPQSRERGEAMDSITRALFMRGPEAAMAYPSTLQDPQLRAGYVAMIAERLASKDAGKAATWLASVADVAAQSRGARRVAEALASQDVTRAADWVGKLSPEARAEAASGVIHSMSAGDIPGTARWVSTLNGIPNYDRVVEEFVWSCDYRAPEQSAAWIQGISDPAQRTRLYHRMLGEWARRDANAVKNWVANNSVPQSVAQRFNR